MAHDRILPLIAAAVLATVAAGCAGAATTGGAPEVNPFPGQTTAPTPTLTASDLPTASPGGDQETSPGGPSTAPGPDVPRRRQPSLLLAGLPVGGDRYDGSLPDIRCVTVRWIGFDATDLTTGVAVRITGFTFEPTVLTVADVGCDEVPPPCTIGFVFAEGVDSCTLPARLTDPDARHDQPSVSVSGRLDCSRVSEATCGAFRDAAKAGAQRIPLGRLSGGSGETGETGGGSGGSGDPGSQGDPGDPAGSGSGTASPESPGAPGDVPSDGAGGPGQPTGSPGG